MEITPTTIILVGVVCVVLGFLASMLLNTLSDDHESEPATVDEAPPGGRKGQYLPLVRLWRERSSGTLVVEMEGKSMVSPEPMTENQREQLEKSARELRGWLGMGLAAAEPVVEAQLQPDVDLNRAIFPEPVKPVPPTATQPTVSAPQPDRAQVSPPQSTTPTAAQGNSSTSPASKMKDEITPAPASKSIVMQIEDILQDMIAGTPLENRGIHLTEDPIRGVIVQVGLDRYEGIDSVKDPEAKKVIQAAVQEWEKSQ